MRSLVAVGLTVIAFSGCVGGGYWNATPGQPMPVVHDNPMFLPMVDHGYVWETVVDVIDDYFKIQREEPVRLLGDTLTEGHLETFYSVGPTILEPWLNDSVGPRDRIEGTLQSIRRRATVRVMPAEGGYWVEVAVFKELEDVARPEHATAGAATFRYDESLTRVVNPVNAQQINQGWIRQGRDTALQQRILGQLQSRWGQGLTTR